MACSSCDGRDGPAVSINTLAAHRNGLVLHQVCQAQGGFDAVGLAALGCVNLADAHALWARGGVHLQRVAIDDVRDSCPDALRGSGCGCRNWRKCGNRHRGRHRNRGGYWNGSRRRHRGGRRWRPRSGRRWRGVAMANAGLAVHMAAVGIRTARVAQCQCGSETGSGKKPL